MNEIVTHMSVSRDHPSLPGHFPGRPIVPGVVLLDLIFEAIRDSLSQPVELLAVASAKFLQAVAPETRVDVEIKLMPDESAGRVKARFLARHATTPVLEGSFLLKLVERAP